MAARQAVLGGIKAGDKGRRRPHTIAESAVVGVAAAEAAAMPEGWTPSPRFDAWKREVSGTAGINLFWDNIRYYKGFTPDARKEAIDSILRTTIMPAYESDNFYEGVLASHDDYAAMQAYAAAFLDAFWEDFWAEHQAADREAGAGVGPCPASRRPARSCISHPAS